jgi:hypothetical protein
MPGKQLDLFPTAPTREQPSDEIVAIIRKRLHAKLALVKSAQVMPWTDLLDIIREDNAFRHAKDALPAAEGAALWAAFEVEMERLYAIMDEGLEPEPEPPE